MFAHVIGHKKRINFIKSISILKPYIRWKLSKYRTDRKFHLNVSFIFRTPTVCQIQITILRTPHWQFENPSIIILFRDIISYIISVIQKKSQFKFPTKLTRQLQIHTTNRLIPSYSAKTLTERVRMLAVIRSVWTTRERRWGRGGGRRGAREN